MSPWSEEATLRQPRVPTGRPRTVREGRVQCGGHIGVGIRKATGRNEEKQKMKTYPLCKQKAGKVVGTHDSVLFKKEVVW